jgi:hypothetical protein
MARVLTAQIDAELLKVAGIADRARDLALRNVDRIKRVRGAAAVRELGRVRARDGEDSASGREVASLMLRQVQGLARLREELQATKIVSRATPDTVVLGTIVGADGRPAAGALVRLTTDTDKPIGEAVTDDAGAYIVERPREELRKLSEGAKSLVIVVRDPSGRELHTKQLPIPTSESIVMRLDLSSRVIRRTPATSRSAGPVAGAVLKDIRGLAEGRIKLLAKAGITQPSHLAHADAQEIASLLRVSRETAEEFIEEARKLAP